MNTYDSTTIQAVPADTLRQWIDDGAVVLVDVREPDEFGGERIGDARLLPLGQICRDSVPDEFGLRTVLYCQGGHRSAMAAERLALEGASEVLHLEGGIKAWKAAGLPTVGQPSGRMSIMRQVHLTAGMLVVLGVVLGAFVSPWFLILAGFVGCGLMFAGLTGTCGLAMLIKRMPWNRRSTSNHSRCKPACCS
ncbi:MAG: rhodanese-like domain-containing protein [Phycisphaerales bacterium]|nr:rhodanese-like domain-containing protein [Phycisphaerales bacterium]